MFTKKDLIQIQNRGLDHNTVAEQINYLQKGFPFIPLIKPATVNDGIRPIVENKAEQFIKIFNDASLNLKILKFVPASGAATRMFKSLFNFLETYKNTEEDYLALISDKSTESPYHLFEKLSSFPFYKDLVSLLHEKDIEIEKLLEKNSFIEIVKLILTKEGLNLGSLPKALIKFHRYTNHIRTALGEHLVEAANYCKNDEGKAYLHCTVSPEHLSGFHKYCDKYCNIFEERYDTKYDIEFSVQKPKTDTIAIDLEGKPFRDKSGNILFRPGGHGSLIENLNELDADIIFIKNIDNVVPDRLKVQNTYYKKILGGILIQLRNQIFGHTEKLNDAKISESALATTARFIKKELGINVPKSDKQTMLAILNRPIRVCGMVPNEDEPGGGPFWVKNIQGDVSLQIVESSQIDINDEKQNTILNTATHFNPVDIVCSTKNYKGDKFNLPDYVDKNTGFVSIKSFGGRSLKALEHPGLWNGAMANWNTVFVEVPAVTFNPVKTIFDLLRPEHHN